ncbi:probable serine/threonine-protein kinase samkC [Planococcus citri]|uniref:probable serine/threonine-protein kinase samkC n=1 Tax=Planococcus citri TaxID=170843 RepID=UPI0031F7B673
MECESKSKKMVATLQSRKEALECKLREKTAELKKLCIQEAELTGVLPPETPIEPGESPPVFRRRIGTSFAYPENLINKLKSKEEESLAKLELECKIQTSIAEAALGLANDGNASKSIRRKHRLMYQQSQRRLSELEARLTVLRQSVKSTNQLKQRKKPRPPLTELDCVDGPEASAEVDPHFKHSYNEDPASLSTINREILRNGQFYNSFGKSHNYPGYVHHQNQHVSKNTWNRNLQYRRSVERPRHNSGCYDAENTNWLEDSNMWRNTAPVGYFSNQCYTTLPNESPTRMKSRYGSLDRRYKNSDFTEEYPRYPGSSHVTPSPPACTPVQHTEPNLRPPSFIPSPDSSLANVVLLPNQTYPENSLMRTQSLGNVEHSRKSLDTHSLQEKVQENFQSNTLGRKPKEKEWRETSLDSDCYERRSRTPPLHPRASKVPESPVPQRPYSRRSTRTPPPPPLPPPPHCSAPSTPPPIPAQSKSPVKSPTLIESTVPFESPKNHTVVEVGKWQPYREVTKPFEMSDFYKYSTKFRKNPAPEQKPPSEHHTLPQNRNIPYRQQFPDNTHGIHRSHEDINKNTFNNENQFFDTKPLNNITYRKHRPLTMMVSDNNGNCATIKSWHNEDS